MKKKVSNTTFFLVVGLMLLFSVMAGYFLTRENEEPSQAVTPNTYTATFSMTPTGSVTKAIGETFTVSPTVNISAGTAAYAFQLDVRYNPAVLEFMGFTKNAANTICTTDGGKTEDTTTGKLVYAFGCMAPNPLTSANPNFSPGTISFRTKAAGNSAITLQPYNAATPNVTTWAADKDGDAFQTNTVSGSYSVTVNQPVGKLTVSPHRTVVMPNSYNNVKIVVTAFSDAGGTQPISGKTVTLSGGSSLKTGDSITPSSATTDSTGKVTFTLKTTSTLYDRTINLTANSDVSVALSPINVAKVGDIKVDNQIGTGDLAVLMSSWSGTAVVGENVNANINITGTTATADKVDTADLSLLMSSWGL